MTPEQKGIHSDLLLISEGCSAFFADACAIMADRKLKATTHLVGHLMREIEGSIRAVLDPENKKNQNGSGHKESVGRVVQELGLTNDSEPFKKWCGFIDKSPLAKWAHRDQHNPPRVADQHFIDCWEEFQDLLTVILKAFRENFGKITAYLDSVLQISNPIQANANELSRRLPGNWNIRHYFFSRLSNPSWLNLLASKYFEDPPALIRNEDGSISVPTWPQALYLIRIADQKPDEVMNVILAIDTDNFTVMAQLVEAALKIPPDKAKEVVPKLCQALSAEDSHRGLLSIRVVEFLGRLIAFDCIDEATALCKVLLQPFCGLRHRFRSSKC